MRTQIHADEWFESRGRVSRLVEKFCGNRTLSFTTNPKFHEICYVMAPSAVRRLFCEGTGFQCHHMISRASSRSPCFIYIPTKCFQFFQCNIFQSMICSLKTEPSCDHTIKYCFRNYLCWY